MAYRSPLNIETPTPVAWLGVCRACGTSVFVDDEFIRVRGSVLHR
jgi:hypothetical protein